MLLVRCRNRREVLIPLDGLLSAQFATAEDEDGGNDGDNAADDDPKCAVAFVLHDVFQRLLRVRGSDWVSREFGENRCRNRAIS